MSRRLSWTLIWTPSQRHCTCAPKAWPERAPWRPNIGIAGKITDAELITLAVMRSLLGYTGEACWLRYTRSHLGHLFRYRPKQPGYNKRLRALEPTPAG
jgi:hypothetical protein